MQRNDRSLILYPTLEDSDQLRRWKRCQALRTLRDARRVYHLLRAGLELTDAGALQVQWKLRELGAGLGVRLVIAGATCGTLGFGELN